MSKSSLGSYPGGATTDTDICFRLRSDRRSRLAKDDTLRDRTRHDAVRKSRRRRFGIRHNQALERRHCPGARIQRRREFPSRVPSIEEQGPKRHQGGIGRVFACPPYPTSSAGRPKTSRSSGCKTDLGSLFMLKRRTGSLQPRKTWTPSSTKALARSRPPSASSASTNSPVSSTGASRIQQ